MHPSRSISSAFLPANTREALGRVREDPHGSVSRETSPSVVPRASSASSPFELDPAGAASSTRPARGARQASHPCVRRDRTRATESASEGARSAAHEPTGQNRDDRGPRPRFACVRSRAIRLSTPPTSARRPWTPRTSARLGRHVAAQRRQKYPGQGENRPNRRASRRSAVVLHARASRSASPIDGAHTLGPLPCPVAKQGGLVSSDISLARWTRPRFEARWLHNYGRTCGSESRKARFEPLPRVPAVGVQASACHCSGTSAARAAPSLAASWLG